MGAERIELTALRFTDFKLPLGYGVTSLGQPDMQRILRKIMGHCAWKAVAERDPGSGIPAAFWSQMDELLRYKDVLFRDIVNSDLRGLTQVFTLDIRITVSLNRCAGIIYVKIDDFIRG